MNLLVEIVIAVALFAAGMLVGRKNPSIASALYKIANAEKAKLQAADANLVAKAQATVANVNK